MWKGRGSKSSSNIRAQSIMNAPMKSQVNICHLGTCQCIFFCRFTWFLSLQRYLFQVGCVKKHCCTFWQPVTRLTPVTNSASNVAESWRFCLHHDSIQHLATFLQPSTLFSLTPINFLKINPNTLTLFEGPFPSRGAERAMIKIKSYVVITFCYRKANILCRWSKILHFCYWNKGLCHCCRSH